MQKLLRFSGVAALMGVATLSFGQRYLTEIFSSSQINTTSNVVYATNIDFLTSNFTNQAQVQNDLIALNTAIAMGQPFPAAYYNPADASTSVKVTNLLMDIRQPDQTTDPVEARPAIIYVHTGNFLPPLINGGISGSKIDSAAVNLCKQWAKRGFVSVSASYRLGWNPISTDPDVRRGTLLNAVYRAIRDVKMCVRYLKDNAEELGIDPNQIIIYGQGSGGYIANAYMTLDDITELFLPKFLDSETAQPYVDISLVGGIDGYGGALNLYQDNGISADVAFTANAGGAIGDISWLEGGEPPHVSFHCVRDPFAPFNEGTVIVPTTNEDVVEVQGSNIVIQNAVNFGNNNSFASFPSGDPYTDRARSLYGQTLDYIYPAPNNTVTINNTPEGLFPFVKPINQVNVFLNESGPWDWWDFATLQQVVAGTNAALGTNFDATTLHQQGIMGNPDMGPVKGLAHIDTIQGYLVPRIIAALDLVTGIESAPEKQVKLDIFPNPAIDQVTVIAEGEKIDHMELFDLTGKRVRVENINSDRFILHRRNLESGVYLLNLWFDGEKSTNKVIFK
jgi:hypothetical protein